MTALATVQLPGAPNQRGIHKPAFIEFMAKLEHFYLDVIIENIA